MVAFNATGKLKEERRYICWFEFDGSEFGSVMLMTKDHQIRTNFVPTTIFEAFVALSAGGLKNKSTSFFIVIAKQRVTLNLN